MGAYEEGDRVVRPRGQVATDPSKGRDGSNAAYRTVVFTRSAPNSDNERTCSWIAVQNCLILTQGASKIENKLYGA
ncbi:hypothetical protein Taro_047613 [Colocasia esculenta]|uniref:Uncharacterized protein n=1 Tax=Colocasia esculenta TaxID=4460 RepID=A0A843X5M2_COLES|nr:hypothetical protein [Colocasia esculenta]